MTCSLFLLHSFFTICTCFCTLLQAACHSCLRTLDERLIKDTLCILSRRLKRVLKSFVSEADGLGCCLTECKAHFSVFISSEHVSQLGSIDSCLKSLVSHLLQSERWTHSHTQHARASPAFQHLSLHELYTVFADVIASHFHVNS